jgi:GNAT superfamily N-acetyltransferase
MDAVYALWQATLGGDWPLTPARFGHLLTSVPPYHAGDHFVAEEQGRIAGFVATQAQRNPALAQRTGNIMVLFVAPEEQGRGIGRALLDRALEYLRHGGMHAVQIGGRVPRFWPGVPNTMPGALAFFQAQGWTFLDTTYDITQDLRGYRPPPGVLERVDGQGVRLEVAGEPDMPELLAFHDREFPFWTEEYQIAAAFSDFQDFLLARDPNGTLVGSVLMSSPQSHPARTDVAWKGLLGEDAGSINAVGVAAAEQGRGIGLALMARGSEVLLARGTGICHIGWTTLLDFYGKVGYTPWCAYAMSQHEL